jgi:hypothetical protein
MRAFFHIRAMRATVWMVLAVWLFALTAGMANACLLEPQEAHGQATSAALDHGGVRNAHAGHRVDPHETHDYGHHESSKAPCVKVCSEATQSPVQSGAAIDLPFLPVQSHQAWKVMPQLRGRVDDQANLFRVPPDPPPRLKYARLAL